MPVTQTETLGAPLDVGDEAPDFTLPVAGARQTFSLGDAQTRGPVVVAFFPFAFTDLSIRQLHELTDHLDTLEQAGATVVGISCDSAYAQDAFAQTEGIAPTLLSDFDKATARAFGVLYENFKGLGATAKRSVFVVDTDGRIAYAWITDDPSVMPDLREVAGATADAAE